MIVGLILINRSHITIDFYFNIQNSTLLSKGVEFNKITP